MGAFLLVIFAFVLASTRGNSFSATNNFLVTVTGDNTSGVEVLERLRELVASLNGEAFDINECQLIMQLCDITATCMNTLGSFQCTCDVGYALENNITSPCKDLDECLFGANNCSTFAKCQNLVGTYNCSCNDGFYGDGHTCENVNECIEVDCGRNAHCVDTEGSFACVCNDGFEKNENGTICTDIDECASSVCKDQQVCQNQVGSYQCVCKNGYQWNGSYCVGNSIRVACTSTSISVLIHPSFFEENNIQLSELHLADPTCRGSRTPSGEWIIFISGDLLACSTQLQKNRTHVTYSNFLTNSMTEGIFIGSTVTIPFSCSYPTSNIIVNLPSPYYPRTNVINIAGPSGNGTFVVEMNLFTDASYSSVSNYSVFAVTDTIFVQIELIADVESLVLLIRDCWVTSNGDANDVNFFKFIKNGCPISGKFSESVKVGSNGVGRKGNFQSRVFGFVNFNTTYLHCTVDLCSTRLTDNCSTKCVGPQHEQRTGFVDRLKREAPGNFLSLGPFKTALLPRTTTDVVDYRKILIAIFIPVLVLMMLALVYLIVSLRRSKLPVLETAKKIEGHDNVIENDLATHRDGPHPQRQGTSSPGVDFDSSAM